jgi:signal transduction histidine kinase
VTLADELSATFLFENLSADQLRMLADLGCEVSFDVGDTIFVEGEPAEFLWVLLAGEMELERHVGGRRIPITTASRPGTYGGGLQAFTGSGLRIGYRATAKASQPSRFFQLPSSDLGRLVGEWSPLARHLLDGYLQRLESIEATVREQERLASLGRLAAGLAHEVNNPAAAAIRATTELRGALNQLHDVVGWLADADLSGDRLRALLRLQHDAVAAVRPSPRGGIELANAEDKIGTWLDEHDVENSWSLASTFTSLGLDESWLDKAADVLDASELSPGLNWIAATLLSTGLVDQIDDAVGRIAQLVTAVKEYSYVDRAPEQEVDVHEGIEKTLLVLNHKIRAGIQIRREYDDHLPRIQASGAELNQVWTNVIDNAIDAMQGRGQILIRTRRENDVVVVEIGDQGPGIPSGLISRIFDPFFTTKEPGKGTGLGLDIVRRIVVDGHHGDVSVESSPGDTRFIVRLPIT